MKKEIPESPHEIPEPLKPGEIPDFPDNIEPNPLQEPEPEPSRQPEPLP